MHRKSDSYVATIAMKNGKPATEKDQILLDQIKLNTKIDSELFGMKLRVVLNGRLGKNNPNAFKYKGYPIKISDSSDRTYTSYRQGFSILLEDAVRADIYVYRRA